MPLDELDRGQEPLALQPVRVKLRRLDVRRGHQGHAALEQRGEEPAEDHRVGDVGDVELVEAQHPRLSGEPVRDDAQRVLALGQRVQLPVHALHEAVEMHSQLRVETRGVDEQIDEMGLAAPDTAPYVETAHGFAVGAPETSPKPGDDPDVLSRDK